MPSLQRQLRRSNLIALVIAMSTLLALTNYGVNRLATEYILSRLQHDAESVISALQQDDTGHWQLDENRVGAVYHRVHSGHYYAIEGGDIALSSRSLWDRSVDVATLAPGQSAHSIQRGMGPERWLILRRGFEKAGTDFTVWVAEDIEPLRRQKVRYSIWAIAAVTAILLVLLMLQQWFVKRGFARLDKVRVAISRLHEGEDAALKIAMPDEVKPLVAEIERLLLQLQKRVARSRNALGNLVHELKRPLQRLALAAETLDREKQKELIDILDNVQWIIERELKRARIVGVSSPGRHTILDEEIPGLIDIFRRIYPGVHVEANWPPGYILPHDRDDMLELLGNLLDNACQYGGGTVRLEITSSEDGAVIKVRDDGPGIPDELLDQITTRGKRLDETSGGAGLGLAICKDIVDTWSGTLTISSREPQGLEVTVRFPGKTTVNPNEGKTP